MVIFVDHIGGGPPSSSTLCAECFVHITAGYRSAALMLQQSAHSKQNLCLITFGVGHWEETLPDFELR